MKSSRWVWMAAALFAGTSSRAIAQTLPDRLSDRDFWSMVTSFSEAGGYFRSENFVSNESDWQRVIPPLLPVVKQGGAYVGVGPEQNFTYLVAFKPKIAFIVDIRRQNLLHHLWYKAVIEMSVDRADFLSRLFARVRPAQLDSLTTADSLISSFQRATRDTVLFRKTFEAVREALVRGHGFALPDSDLTKLLHVDSAFFMAGPDLNYSFRTDIGSFGSGFGGNMPSFASLMVQNDGTELNRSFLGSEANYRVLRDMQLRNVVVPIVGDFAKDTALRNVGQYLRNHGAVVNAFYVSNVEQYLFMDPDNWRNFYTTVSAMPLDSSSRFIRSVTRRGRIQGLPIGNGMMAQLTCSILDIAQAFKEGRIQAYDDVVYLSIPR